MREENEFSLLLFLAHMVNATNVTPFSASTRANNLWPVDVFLFAAPTNAATHMGDRKCTKPGTNFLFFEGDVGIEGIKDTHKMG